MKWITITYKNNFLFLCLFPDTIVNEHPVTIYPGRASPQRKIPPRTLPGSIERHRDVCRNNESGNNGDNGDVDDDDDDSPSTSSPENIIKNELDLSPPPTAFVNQSIFMNSSHMNRMRRKVNRKLNNNDHANDGDDGSDDFSDDSLEETSLPPPPPPPVVPPPPSLSCPVTPSKRSSIAWDINLDDLNSSEDVLSKSHRPNNTKVKIYYYDFLFFSTLIYIFRFILIFSLAFVYESTYISLLFRCWGYKIF